MGGTMNKQPNTPSKARDPGEASGKHEGLRHPIDDDQRVKQRLDDAGTDDQGEAVEDQLRDRRSSGTPGSEQAGKQDTKRH
jgi:hypothetical protein